jgi:hypothetical protein
MIGRSSTVDNVKANAASGKDLAAALARDRKFRKQVVAAVGHGAAARRRARSRVGLVSAIARLANDEQLRDELSAMTQEVRRAWSRVERKRSHPVRKTVFVVAALGVGGAILGPRVKELLSDGGDGGSGSA